MDPCLSILIGLIILLFMLYKKIPLWIVFLATGVFIGFLNGGLHILVEVFTLTIEDRNTWDLVVIMTLIAGFVELYRVSGFIDKLGEQLVRLLKKPRLITMFVPAILGLLPVPGGALMSIPIVDRVGDHIGLDNVRKLFVNVWFRHVIFIVYPLSNVIILTSSLTGIDLWALISMQIPIAMVMIIIGYLIGFPIIKTGGVFKVDDKPEYILLMKTFTPILSVITLAMAMGFLDNNPYLPFNRFSMIVAVLTGVILLSLFAGLGIKTITRVLSSNNVIEMSLIGFTAMFMRMVFQTIDLTCITKWLMLNPLFALIIIPVTLSLIVGMASSGVILSISILSGLTVFNPETASMIYIYSFLGYLISPLHLCYVYTARYLKTPLVNGYKYLIPATFLTILSTIAIYRVL